MQLPGNSESVVEAVHANSKRLIERGFWDIKMPRLEGWIEQFCGPEERYFAACILNQVVFRTRLQFEAGLLALFRSNVKGNIFTDKQDLHLLQTLRDRSDNKIRLVPVICESDPPTKSGPLVMRRLQRILRLNQKWMRWPWQATSDIGNEGVKAIVFVDDFLGSGSQFDKFFRQWRFDKQSPDVKYIYAPVVAHQNGIDYLTEKLPHISVISAERLTESHNFFSEKVWLRLGQGCITADEAKSWYLQFCRSNKIAIVNGSKPLGYGDLSLTFGFSHSTPNNSLPILWAETTNWQPLLER